MLTLRSVAWDVPVRLVPAEPGSATSATGEERTIPQVDPGVALPGVGTLRVTLQRRGGRDLLVRIEPEGLGWCGAGTPLAELLDGLRAPEDGTVGVLVDGTPFTLAVLEALCRVPVGARITYAELAQAAGRPRAIRAVASVVARNRVPLVIPCHRVVPSSGGTGRYAWGASVKAALLAAETPRRPAVTP